MEKGRVALESKLGIFHWSQSTEEKGHLLIGRSCRCQPSLEIVDENPVIVDYKKFAATIMQESCS
jgi:hypothetical protein